MRLVRRPAGKDISGLAGRQAGSAGDGAGAPAVTGSGSEARGAGPVAIAPFPAAGGGGAVADRRSGLARLAQAARRACSGPYWAPAVLLCGGFLLDPVWTSHPAPAFRELTFGRIVLLATGVLLVAEAIWRRRRLPAPGLPAALLSAGLLAGVVVIGASAAIHGSLRRQGSFAGYDEFVLIVLLVLALTTLAPRFALALLLATAAGTLISAILALSGLQGSPLGGASRLVGAFGNPNYLAFAIALGLSVMLGAQRFVAGRMRIAILLALPVMVAPLVLTYSRSGLIVAYAGTIAALALMRPNLRARLLIAGGAILVAVAAAVAVYPAYQSLRLRSDFASQIASGLPDRSGWDPSAQGFINGGSLLRNPSPGVLQINLRQAIAGVSYPLGMARRGGAYQLSLFVRTSQPDTSVGVGMEDNYAANGPVSTLVSASPAWRQVTETWRPTLDSPHARFYVWATSPGGALYLRDVALTASVPATATRGGPRGGAAAQRLERVRCEVASPTCQPEASSPGTTAGTGSRSRVNAGLRSRSSEGAISTHLLGAKTAGQAFSGRESNFVKSRIDAARLSWKLFREHPLFGVGWEQFGTYSNRELSPQVNAGSPHDDYLRMAAELGIPGVLFLLTCVTGLVIRLRRGGLSRPEQVAVGPLVAAGIGLFFITALDTPSISLSLAAALAILCASPRQNARPAIDNRPRARAFRRHGRPMKAIP